MKKVDQFIFFDNIQEFLKYMTNLTITREITRIQHHHTWKPDYSDFDGKNHAQIMKNLDDYHEHAKGWNDSGHHFMTFPDGVIATARDINVNPAGIYGQNRGSICVENFGNFDKDDMAQKQKDTIIAMTAILCEKFSITPNTYTIIYHHWFVQDTGIRTEGKGNVKTCPGVNFFGGNKVIDCEKNFIPLVEKYLREGDIVKDNSTEQWKVNILKELHNLGLVQDYEGWKIKLDEKAPVWLIFTMILNLYKKLK